MTKPHKHCPVCGTSIPMDERFCSPKCEATYSERVRKVLRTRRIVYAVLAIIVIVYLLYVFKVF